MKGGILIAIALLAGCSDKRAAAARAAAESSGLAAGAFTCVYAPVEGDVFDCQHRPSMRTFRCDGAIDGWAWEARTWRCIEVAP